MEQTDPNDDAALDEVLSTARWPEPTPSATQRLQVTWARISPAAAAHRRRRRVLRGIAAAAALIVIGTSVVTFVLNRKPSGEAVVRVAEPVVAPEIAPAPAPAPVAKTRPTGHREAVRLASLSEHDMLASEKVAIWMEMQQPARRGRHRTVAAPSRQTSRPSATRSAVSPDPAASMAAIRVQLARY